MSGGALKDGYVFDIRKLQTLNEGHSLRLMLSHTVEPIPGSKWTVGNAERRTCWSNKPCDGGRRVAVFLSSDKLVQIFNDVSTQVNTHHLPVFLRQLVKSGQMSLSDVVTAIMKNKVPVGTELEWMKWKDNKERDRSWEVKSIPRVAKTFDDMLNHIKPLVSDEAGDQNEKVRFDFVERVQHYTGLSMVEAEYFVMHGGEVTMAGSLGGGWYKVTVGGELGKYYAINVHEEDEEGVDVSLEEEEEEEEEDLSVRPRSWWQVMVIPLSALISELKQLISASVTSSPQSIETLKVEEVQVMYGGRRLEECKFHDERHDKEEGWDISLKRTLITETETMVMGKDPAHKPRAMCYLCGLPTVTPTSLKWHLSKCLTSFNAAQLRQPKEKRMKRPKPPVLPVPSDYGPLLDAWNREAALIYLMESSPRCRGCGRSYQQQDTLEKHMAKCCPHLIKHEGERGLETELREEPQHSSQDHALSQHSFALCYICNRYTGIASLSWHLRSCGRKFEARQKELPEPLRRDLPEPPATPLPTAFEDLEVYNEEARGIHAEEVRPYCPSCHEVLNDVVADVFGFSLMKHMSFCCPDLLARIEESVLPPVKHTRRGVMGAICVVCSQQFGLAGYGWHLAACYRKYRIRESLLQPHQKQGHFYVRVKVRTPVGGKSSNEITQTLMDLLATDRPEESITLVGFHQILVRQQDANPSEIESNKLDEFDITISRLRSLDVARAVKRCLQQLQNKESSEFLLSKPYISRARPPNPPGAPVNFNPERAWESQWSEPPPDYTAAAIADEDTELDESLPHTTEQALGASGGASSDIMDEAMEEPPSYETSVVGSGNGWLPRGYGYELDRFNSQVEELLKTWQAFCPLCNTTALTAQDVVTFSNEDALRIHMEQCCPAILEKEDKIKQHRHEKHSNFNGTPFSEEVGVVCYLCGQRTVNLTSYPWHLSACVRVWYVAELCKPKKQRRAVPRLPPHVKLPQLSAIDKEVYTEQLREYNNEALKMFNSVGVLQCPRCLDLSSESSPQSSGPKVFKTAKALLQHMDKCCPQLVPGSANADVREAMEKMQSGVDLMGYIAEHCEQVRRNSQGPGHIGIVCHLCNRLCASLAGLEFHRRACMRAWDRMERATREPHRRRLFSWKKDEIQLQEDGEKYGKNVFYWDVPAADVGVNSSLIDHATALKTPRPHKQPGPVPKPPTIALPPPPNLSLSLQTGVNNQVSAAANDSEVAVSFPSRKEYLSLVEKYNKQASQIFSDWQPHCPNFKYIAVKLNMEQCAQLGDDPLKVLKLESFEVTRLKVVSMSDVVEGSNQIKSKIRVGDVLWSVLRRNKDGWENNRINSVEETVEVLRRCAKACLVDLPTDSPEEGDNATNDDTCLILYAKRGCTQSYATTSNLHKHMEKCCPEMLEQVKLLDKSVPDPNADKPIDPTTLPGTVCFVCSHRVLYIGSIPRHLARCFENFDSFELDKRLVNMRKHPPLPPEHVYGVGDGPDTLDIATLRVAVKRYKAGHRYKSSENEWRYDVDFSFIAALRVDNPDLSKDIVKTCKKANFAIRTLEVEDSDDSDSDESDSDSDDSSISDVQVLVVTKSSNFGGKGDQKFELCAGDEVVVTLDNTCKDSQSSGVGMKKKGKFNEQLDQDKYVKAMRLLAVKWPPINAVSPEEALDLLQPLNTNLDSKKKYTLHVKRPMKSPIEESRLWPSMTLAFKEWGIRCADLLLSKQPKCGKKVLLTRTLAEAQLGQVKFILDYAQSPQVRERVPDDEGVLMPGDILVTYGATGTKQVRLAHGVPPYCLVEALRRSCRLSKTGEVTLQLLRYELRPAFAMGLKDAQWCEKLKRVDDMDIREVKRYLLKLNKCGLPEATQEGDRLERRDRLKMLLLGGCGRSFATHSAVIKHMKECCIDSIDPDDLEEHPLAAAARTLGVQSDAGLQGVDQDFTRFPHGQPGWICYLCGERTLSLPSFKFHLQSCARAWDNYELGKHPSRWRPPPKPPTPMKEIPPTYSAQLAQYNKQAQAIFLSIMACCPQCAKTFKSEDALDRHMQECCPDILKKLQPVVERDPIGNDYTLPCHVCGRRLVSSDSLKRHIKTCLRAWYRREKDGKLPYERLAPPPTPSLPIPTDKSDIPAYRAEAMAIFEASLPACGLNTKFPVNIRTLRRWEKDLFGSGEFGSDEKLLLYLDQITCAITVAKATKDMTRFTGLRRYDKLLAIVPEQGDDWLAGDSLEEAYDVFASTNEGYVWFERHCTLTFQDEVKRDKHRVSCRTAIVAGLLIPTEISGDKPTRDSFSKEPSDRSVYRSYGVTEGRNEFMNPTLSRVPVYGDTHHLHAKGALQRRQDDARIAQENAKLANKLAKAPSSIAKPSNEDYSRSRFKAVSRHEKERIDRENERLGKTLRALYSKHMHINKNYGGVVGDATRIVRYYEGYAHKRIEGEDYSGAASQVHKWENRTRIYHNPLGQPSSHGRTDTPKTLGVAVCSGCGIKRFHGEFISLRRCCGVVLPELDAWKQEEGSFAERLEVSLKFLGLNTIKKEEKGPKVEKPLFGGNCVKNVDITDVPWYCDDTCAIAGWITHSRACLHRPRFDGHGGFAAQTEDPWVLNGSKYKQGITGELRRYLSRAQCLVEYPSGQTELIKELDRFVQGRKNDPVTHTSMTQKEKAQFSACEAYRWIQPKLICRLRRITPKGDEKLVEVKIVKVKFKPTTKELMEELGRLIIEDEDLLIKVKGSAAEEEPLEEGLRCFYCYDEVRNNDTYEQHVKVCRMRWRRIEALKPAEERRPEPQRPTLTRPTDVNQTEQVAEWSAAAKEAMGPLDGYNPNGGGALQRWEEAEQRAGGVAAYQQLNIALDHMDKTALAQLIDLDKLRHRMAWEASGGGSVAALKHGTALQNEKYSDDVRAEEEEFGSASLSGTRLAKTHARTLRHAQERDHINKPTPVSYDVMGPKRNG